MTPRDYLVELAVAAIGLSASPDKSLEYINLIVTSGDDRASDKRCAEMAQMFSCALTCRGLLYRAGVRHQVLIDPYRNQRAVSDLVEIATDAKALRDYTYIVQPADMLIIGEGNNVHCLTVRTSDGHSIDSIDGGQHEGVFEAIEERQRIEVDTRGARYVGGRLTQYCICYDAIVACWDLERFLPTDESAADTDPAPPG